MKLIVVAGPPSVGKTSAIKHVLKKFSDVYKISYIKIDVSNAKEDVELSQEFQIHALKVYSGDLCPDHAEVMVMQDAIQWAQNNQSDLLIVESAGLCLRCSPFLNQGLSVAVLDACSGSDRPEKMSSMISFADIILVTKIDMVSQVEREVLIQKIKEKYPDKKYIEGNTLQGTSLQLLYKAIENSDDIDTSTLQLKGSLPLGTCTICVGKKDIGWQNHYGVVRKLGGDIAECFFRGD